MTDAPLSRFRWIWYAIGLAMIVWGVSGLLQHTSTRGLTHTLRFAAVGLASHDGLFAPVAFIVGYATQRLLPGLIRTPVRVGLAISAVLILLALPMIQSDHRQRTSSILPLPYERNLAIMLGLVLAGVVVSIVISGKQKRQLSRAEVTEQSPPAQPPG